MTARNTLPNTLIKNNRLFHLFNTYPNEAEMQTDKKKYKPEWHSTYFLHTKTNKIALYLSKKA